MRRSHNNKISNEWALAGLRSGSSTWECLLRSTINSEPHPVGSGKVKDPLECWLAVRLAWTSLVRLQRNEEVGSAKEQACKDEIQTLTQDGEGCKKPNTAHESKVPMLLLSFLFSPKAELSIASVAGENSTRMFSNFILVKNVSKF